MSPNYRPWMNHSQRQARRALMAKLVAEGKKCWEVAGQFEVTVATVKKACREHGVPPRGTRAPCMGLYA